MIDIKFLRENPEAVKENIRKKFQDEKLPLVDEVIALDKESRQTQQEADDLRASRHKISKEIGVLMKAGKREESGRTGKKGGRTSGKDPEGHDDNSKYHRPFRADRKRRQ